MAQVEVTREQLIEDAVFILQCLRQNQRGGRSNGLAEVQKTLGNSVTLDLSDYVAFLKRFGYVDVDRRQAALQLTDAGDQAATGALLPRVAEHVGEFFSALLAQGRVELDEVDGSALDTLLRSAGLEAPAEPPAPEKHERTDPGFLSLPVVRLQVAEGEIGQGALAVVRAARQGELQRAVAVKQWKPLHQALPFLTPAELGKRVLREAKAQSELQHPCVMPVLDVVTQGASGPLLVMPVAQGGSLRARLSQPLPLVEALRAGVQVAHALATAHAHKLSHTAVRPENVLFDGRGNALLSDFGTLRLIEAPPAPAGERSLRLRVDLGDARYRAPELDFGQAADAAADAWSFGVVLFEMLTGALPGRRSPAPSGLRQEVPREVDDLCDDLLEDEPSRRPSLAVAAQRLALAMGEQPLYQL